MWKMIVSFILIIIGLFFVKTMDWKKKITFYQGRFDKTNDQLKDNLLKKYDLLVKQINIFKKKKKLKIEEYEEFINITKKDIDINELDKIINEYENKLNIILQDNNKLIKEANIKKNNNEIERTTININGIKKYYNNMGTKYNKYIKRFPINIITKIKKYQEVELYNINEKDKLKVLDN